MKSIKESISKAELNVALEKKERIRIIDVRNPEEYNNQHIPEAVNVPLDLLESKAGNFSRDHLFVITCGKGGGRSAKGAELLKSLGYNAQWLEGGTNGWFIGA